MRRFLLELQFYGKRYSGFQRQKNAPTIQGEVEKALFKLFGMPIEIVGCSRTDSGVSAESYFCHFDVDSKLPADRVCYKLNKFLPKDIQAISSREVESTFHARKNVKSKTYLYTLYKSDHVLPLYAREGAQLAERANISDMGAACEPLLGEHDFSAFRTVGYEEGTENKSCVRTIYDIKIVEEGEHWVKIYVTGDGFLYNMVRIIVGTLCEVAEGKRSVQSVEEALISRDRQKAGKTMPPKGLRLYKVEY